MFEQIKHSMETITGVGIYPIMSLVIFFLFFLILGIWVIFYSKERLRYLSDIPLNDNLKIQEQ
ncbi:CcoQ/FixQ family Cbb3-type cytochrome c oxidase assembly chaperone [Flavobacterium magnum]|uniref:CcoQ/FixQ family Cbb3-type cytochrome c oxidase assembly chaperone n=1 Tax=Flavobacterium magnum TaxID=2162713 RepID=A0A2S0RH33_9FLAO|nr:CcoQ/FixQ family Cbb3-type cytochrome c oxidase assembly chaperone [Flavobacterium magnum]AWA30925.1 CcoQ/FixQ family Cbb3-type cytochrome c oxidase assembly chaperone [Flavobacterium magnum]